MKLGTICDLVVTFEKMDKETLGLPVFVNNAPPFALSSYRGYYDCLAIETDGTAKPGQRNEVCRFNRGATYAIRIAEEPKVIDLVNALLLAVGEEFEGYKGGSYRMGVHTPLWVADYGQDSGLKIAGLEAFPDRVDLVTKRVDY